MGIIYLGNVGSCVLDSKVACLLNHIMQILCLQLLPQWVSLEQYFLRKIRPFFHILPHKKFKKVTQQIALDNVFRRRVAQLRRVVSKSWLFFMPVCQLVVSLFSFFIVWLFNFVEACQGYVIVMSVAQQLLSSCSAVAQQLLSSYLAVA